MALNIPVHERAVERLTTGQRECLDLVAQLQSSKQIARRLGISPYTVDQRVARACRALGTTTRADAALMVVRHEAGSGSRNESDLDKVVVDQLAELRPAFPQLTRGTLTGAGDQQLVDDAPFRARETARLAALPFPTLERPGNEMNYLNRLGWAAVIFAAGIIVVGVLLTSLTALKGLA